MRRYLLLSVPLALAVVCGLIACGIALAVMDYPSREEIDAAPVYTGPGPAEIVEDDSFDMEAFERKWAEKTDNVDEDTRVIEADKDSKPTKRVVVSRGQYRQNLQITRDNAFIAARKTGAVTALIVAALGYLALGVYFFRLSRKAPRTIWRDAVGGTQPAAIMTTTSEGEPSYGEALSSASPLETPPADEPPEADEPPFEPYEPPIDISELDKAHEETGGGNLE